MKIIILASLAFGFTLQLSAMEADPKSDEQQVFTNNLMSQLQGFAPMKASLVEKMDSVEDAKEEQIIIFEEVSLENVDHILKKATDMPLDDRILLIKKAFIFSDISNEALKEFTRLIDILAIKFPIIPRKILAERFGTPIADNYILICNEFKENILARNYTMESFNESVDPNFSYFEETSNATSSLLTEVYYDIINNQDENKIGVFGLLLNRGAQPGARLMEKARKYANRTELNKKLLELLEKSLVKIKIKVTVTVSLDLH